MNSKKQFDLGADNFPDVKEDKLTLSVPNPYQFFTEASDDMGESESITCRLPPSMGRMIDEAVMEGKALGCPLKTKSDFLRYAVTQTLPAFVQYLEISKKSLTHNLLLLNETQEAAYQAHQVTEVNKGVERLVKGIVVMVGPDTNAVTEAKIRVSSFLSTVLLTIESGNEFVGRMYLTKLFRNNTFKAALKKIDAMIGAGPIIEKCQEMAEEPIE
jgi:Arc/MetJ-type ribon-helix-helix transcriptional regulator